MDVRDYVNHGPGDEILGGLGLSFLLHLALVVMLVSVPWGSSPKDTAVSYCSVRLLYGPAAGNGSPRGAEGRAGGGSIQPAPSAETVPAPPDPEKALTPPAQVAIRDSVPLTPVHKATGKAEEKQKPKLPPRIAGRPSRTTPRIAEKDTSRPPTSGEAEQRAGTPAGLRSEESTANGPGAGEGSGEGNAGDGPGAASGSGAGAGAGLLDVAFGSGNGPRFDSKTLPNYPRLARELGKEGTVLLRVTIDEHGRLMDVEVLKGAGSGFDEEALKAVRSSTFCPAKRNGAPVPCRAHLPIRFVLTRTQ